MDLEKHEFEEESQSNHEFELKPFGNFDWDNSLPDVLNKMLSDKSIKKITVKVFPKGDIRQYLASESISIKSKQDITNLFTNIDKFLKKHSAHIIEPIKTFNDGSNKNIKYFDGEIHVIAEPFNIKKVDFSLKAKFTSSRGFGVKNPSKVLNGNGYKLPLIFSSMELGAILYQRPENYQLLKLNREEISKTLNEKYQKYNKNWSATDLNTLYDAKGRKLFVLSDVTRYIITYDNSIKLKDYEELYLEILNNSKNNKIDSSKDL